MGAAVSTRPRGKSLSAALSIRAVSFVEGVSQPHVQLQEGDTTMPQYLMSVWHDEPYDDFDFSSPEMQRIGAQVNEFNASLERAGAWVFGIGLRPASSATVVRAAGSDV